MYKVLITSMVFSMCFVTANAEEKHRSNNRVQNTHQHTGHHHQNHGWRGWGWGGHHGWGRNHHASTAAQGYLSGLGDMYRGAGMFLMGKGRYLIDFETARKMYIDNWKHAVRSRWELMDENKSRWHRDNPDPITRENSQLDMLEKRAELNARKKKLMKKGILEKPPESAFFWRGEKYSSYAEFKASPKFEELKTEARMRTFMRNLEISGKQQKLEEAHKFLSKWNKMGTSAKDRYIQTRDIEKLLSEPFDGEPKYRVIIKPGNPPTR